MRSLAFLLLLPSTAFAGGGHLSGPSVSSMAGTTTTVGGLNVTGDINVIGDVTSTSFTATNTSGTEWGLDTSSGIRIQAGEIQSEEGENLFLRGFSAQVNIVGSDLDVEGTVTATSGTFTATSASEYAIDSASGIINRDGAVNVGAGSATSPSLTFGDVAGFYRNTNNEAAWTTGSASIIQFDNAGLRVNSPTGPRVRNVSVSATSPGFAPSASDLDTGLGLAAEDQLSLIAGGIEGLRLTEVGSTVDANFTGPVTTTSGTITATSASVPGVTISSSLTILDGVLRLEGAVGTFPQGIVFGDGDTGISEVTDDQLRFTMGGSTRWNMNTDFVSGFGGDNPKLMGEVASLTNPIFVSRDDETSGLSVITARPVIVVSGATNAIFDPTAVTFESSATFSATSASNPGVTISSGLTVSDGVLRLEASAGTGPQGIIFGDGDTRISEQSDDALAIIINGSTDWIINLNGIINNAGNRPGMLNAATSLTVPSLVPSGSDLDTGLGQGINDELGLVAGGVTGLIIREVGSAANTVIPVPATFDSSATFTATSATDFGVDISSGLRAGGTAEFGDAGTRSTFTASGILLISTGTNGIGVGVSAPAASVHIQNTEGSANGNNVSLGLENTLANGGNWRIRSGADGTNTPVGGLSFGDANDYVMVLSSANQGGFVGIGTLSPVGKLHIVDADETAFRIQATGGDARVWSLLVDPSFAAGGFSIYDQTADANRILIETGGQVGINTTNPVSQLDVNGGIRPALLTADPCGGADFPEGTMFYNDTANLYCFCDGTNDVRMNDPTTGCF